MRVKVTVTMATELDPDALIKNRRRKRATETES